MPSEKFMQQHYGANGYVSSEPKPAPQAEGLTLVEDRNGDKRHYQSDEVDAYIAPLLQKIAELEAQIQAWKVARPISEYHEDMGCALWFKYPIDEPPYVGDPNCCNWPGYHTHFVRLANEMIPDPDVSQPNSDDEEMDK